MGDAGFLSGFIGKGIDIAITQILHHAGIALRCNKELNDLRNLVRRIEPTAIRIRQYRLELNRNRGTRDNNASQWVHDLLRQALPLVQKCTIPSFNVFARYQMSRDISSLISEIKEHLEVVPLIQLEQQTEIYLEMRRESAQASSSSTCSASTSQAPTGTFFIEEALIVGQDQAFATLENFVIDAEVKTVFCTGVVGKGGSGKTLLLKRVFNSEKVRDLFRDDLLLWLTVSLSPSFSSLRNMASSLRVLDLSGNPMESLPKSVGSLKQLVSLHLRGMPIKRLPAALTNLATLQVLDLTASNITELPFGIHKLTSLRRLDLCGCYDLQCLPRSISSLTSLQYLNTWGSEKVWTKHDKKKAASLNDLASLRQLKKLGLSNRAETVSEGTLGSMLQMETLTLDDEVMMSLPGDMMNMSKLKRLTLSCPEIVTIDGWFCEFQNLTRLCLLWCVKLEELPSLHKMKSLRELQLHACSKLKKLPIEFGEKGAFLSLEIFSLSDLDELEELPIIMAKEDVMPSLKTFTIIKCKALKLYLKTLQKIRVFGCSLVLENLENIKLETEVKVITMSLTKEIVERYLQKIQSREVWLYSDSWCNEFFLFLQELYVSNL